MMNRPQARSHGRLALAARTLTLLFVVGLSLFIGSEARGQGNQGGRLDWRLGQLVSEFEAGKLPASTAAEVHGVHVDHGRARVIVQALQTSVDEAEEHATSAGGRVETSYGSLLQVEVPIGRLRNLASSSGVTLVRPPLKAYTTAITGEGVALTNANAWQTAGLTGAGVKVAVLDLGFQGYEAELGDELPASVTAMSFVVGGDIYGGGEKHGTGVAEIVHEMAPDAQMYLANFSTEAELADAVSWLHDQGVHVINASWGYFTSGPGDGTGIVDQIITDSVNSGVFWSVAAGNHAGRHWSGQFVDTDNNGFNEFAASPFDEGNEVGGFFGLVADDQVAAELKWNDPFGAACRDYDLFLERTVDGQPDPLVVASSEDVQNDGTQCMPNADPVEVLTFTVVVDDVYHLVIKKKVASSDATLDLYSAYQDLEYETPANSVLQPGDNPGVTTVGAVPYFWPTTIEAFSSMGPTTDNRIKPDIAAPDGVSNATFGNFFGTSAASPHIAGAAALVLGILPCLTPAQTGLFLESQVVDLGSAGKDNAFGSGRLSLGGTPEDADADGIGTACDNCPNWSNASQALPSWPIPTGDAECDGFPDSVAASNKAPESYIGTDPAAHCAATGTPNDEPGADAMPPDFNDDRLINGQDSGKFGGPFGSFNKTVAMGPFGGIPGERFDFNGNGIINGQDTGKFQPYFNKTCA